MSRRRGSKSGFSASIQILRRLLRQIRPDGRSGGQPRGLDAQGLEEAAACCSPMQKSSLAPARWARSPAKLVITSRMRQARHALAGHVDGHKSSPVCRGGGAVPVLLVRGGGADQQVSVDRGRHQHALAHGRRAAGRRSAAPDRRPSCPAGSIRPGGARCRRYRCTDLVMEHVAPHTGGADHGPGLQRSPATVSSTIAVPRPADALHPGVEAELRAVVRRRSPPGRWSCRRGR